MHSVNRKKNCEANVTANSVGGNLEDDLNIKRIFIVKDLPLPLAPGDVTSEKNVGLILVLSNGEPDISPNPDGIDRTRKIFTSSGDTLIHLDSVYVYDELEIDLQMTTKQIVDSNL